MSEQFEAASISLTGDRPMNQDRALMITQGESTMLCVADGLGGHPRGEIASQLVADVCEAMFRQELKPVDHPDRFMMRCLHKAHQAIVAYGDRQDPPISPRTTAVLALVQNGLAHWMHAGDSRLYLIRDGDILMRTDDHSRPQQISQSPGRSGKVRTNVTRCLGGLDQPPVITAGPPTELHHDDVLLLCSDGLWSQIREEKLISTTKAGRSIRKVVRKLASSAKRHGAPRSDNVTALALRWLSDQPTHARPPQAGDVMATSHTTPHHPSSQLT